MPDKFQFILLVLLLIAGETSLNSCKAAGLKTALEKNSSEGLLAFGIDKEQAPKTKPELVKNRSFKVLKIHEAPLQLSASEALPELGENTQMSELEEFLSHYEPASGPALPEPPKPSRKSVFRQAMNREADQKKPKELPHSSIVKLRVGEHNDFTRIVLDASAESQFHIEVDNKEKMIYVDLPNADWEALEKWYSTEPPLVMAWLAKPNDDGKGTRLVIRLKKEARLIHEEYLPDVGYPWHRIIFDLKAAT